MLSSRGAARLTPRVSPGNPQPFDLTTKRVRSPTIPIIALSLSAFALKAQDPPPTAERTRAPVGTAALVTEPPTIDGHLSDIAWNDAEILSDFVQHEPVEGEPVSERTEIRLVYDESALYVGAWMFVDDPSTIVVGETRRDASLQNTDAFVMVIDTYLDRQNGFVFGTTPAGIEFDAQVTRDGQGGGRGGGGGGGGGPRRQQAGSGGSVNRNWDGAWEVATSTDENGWYAELRIPFDTLRYLKGGAQTWGVNFARFIRIRNERSMWSPIPRQFTLFRVSLAGTLTEFEAPNRKIFTVTPYVLGDVSRDYTRESAASGDGTIGGEAKIGLTQSLTLDLTVNTDFAQVEVDDLQVNLTRFPLFFPEKRPFFLENAGSFSVGSPQSAELFFSRRIGLFGGESVPIPGGARLTGKMAGMQVGFLAIQANHLDVFDDDIGEDVRVEPPNNFGVVRLFGEFENRTRVGGIFVSRVNTDNASDYNLTYAVDGTYGIGEAINLTGWAAGTTTPGVDDGQYGLNFRSSYNTREWRSAVIYREIGAEFNPEVGFLPRRDYRHITTFIRRAFRFPNVEWFRELRPLVLWQQFWDLEGFSESYIVRMASQFEFSNGAFFQFSAVNFTGEGLKEPFEISEGVVIPSGTYENFDWRFTYNTNLGAPFSVQGTIDAGGFYSGRRVGTTTTVNYRYQDKFVTSLRVAYFDVNLKEGDFITSVVALKGSYSFTPRIFLQATVQYNNETEDVGSNIRFGWLNTAGTGLYVVYNDIRHFGAFDRTGFERGPKGRQLIVKYTKQFDIGR